MNYDRARTDGLGEFTSEELVEELMRRQARRASQRCDYCNRLPTQDPCRFPQRHNLSTTPPAVLFADAFGRLRAGGRA